VPLRRREPAKPRANALVAAATRITLDDKKQASRQAAKRQAWQDDAWAYFDDVPELKYSVWFLGNALAKLVIFPAVTPMDADVDADPVPVDDDLSDLPSDIATSAQAELDRLNATPGGISGMVRRLNMNLEVAAEGYLVGRGAIDGDGTPENPGRAEEWMIRSVSEVDVKNGVYYVKTGPDDTTGERIDPKNDTCIRLWQEHPRWAGLADNAMRGVLSECKVLQVLSQQVMAQAMRAASAGFITIPNELSFGGPNPTDPEDGAAAGADPLLEFFAKVLVNPIEDPSDPASVQPGLIRGPAEFLTAAYLRHFALWDKDFDASLEERIKARIERIARGLNLPVEVVMGHQATTYANAEQVDQDTFEDHLEPRCRLICDALTIGYLRPNLLDAGYPANLVARVRFWFDPSALIAQPDTEKNAPVAHKAFAISDAAFRRSLGFSEDDAPEPIEVLIRSGLQRGILTAELTAALLQALADEAGVDLPSAPAELAPGQPPAGGEPATTTDVAHLAELLLAARARRVAPTRPAIGGGARGRGVAASAAPDYGARLTGLDRELRTRLVVAANDAMTRALDRAGARMRTKATGQRDVLRNVPNRLVASTLGPTLALRAATEDDAFAGAWDELERQFMAWGGNAQSEALDIVGQLAAGFTASERTTLGLRQADDLATAWEWMKAALQRLASELLFDPNPAEPLGEFDATLTVPTGLVRQAISRAGGATGLITDGTNAYVTLADAGTRPAGGIGTGELVRGALRDEGVSVEGYRWVYGPAQRRTFEPHHRLDGVEFVNFDDPALANHRGWPPYAFYLPGDHAGCVCDVEPIIIPAG
jgi:hypothetical protein